MLQQSEPIFPEFKVPLLFQSSKVFYFFSHTKSLNNLLPLYSYWLQKRMSGNFCTKFSSHIRTSTEAWINH